MAQFTKADRGVASVARPARRSSPAHSDRQAAAESGLSDLQHKADASAAVHQLARWTGHAIAQRRANVPTQETGGLSTSGGLPADLQQGAEQLSGMSLDGVRVHRDSPAPERLGALAYAQGRDIHLGSGQEQHLPHEAWHVVQQMQGRVRATHQMKGSGVAINDDAGLEREADVMGAKAASFSAQKEPAKDA